MIKNVILQTCSFIIEFIKSKKEGKDQESLQSSTTPYPETPYGKVTNTRKRHKQKYHKGCPFLAGDHKAARNRQDSIIKTILK